MCNKVSKEWIEIRNKYQGQELTEFLIIQYVSLGKYSLVAERFNVSVNTMRVHINKYLQDVKYEKPYIYDLYIYKLNKEDMLDFSGRKFTPQIFETFPSRIKYEDFLEKIIKYNTRGLTGNQLIKMANEYGTKVYEIIKGKERLIKVK